MDCGAGITDCVPRLFDRENMVEFLRNLLAFSGTVSVRIWIRNSDRRKLVRSWSAHSVPARTVLREWGADTNMDISQK